MPVWQPDDIFLAERRIENRCHGFSINIANPENEDGADIVGDGLKQVTAQLMAGFLFKLAGLLGGQYQPQAVFPSF